MVPEPIPRLDERYFADLLQIRCKGRADVVRGERSPKHRLWPNAHAGRPSRRGRSASGLFVSPCQTPALVSSMAKKRGILYARIRVGHYNRRGAPPRPWIRPLKPALGSPRKALQQLAAEAAPTARLSTTTSPGTCPLGETGNEMVLARPLGDRIGRVFVD